MLSLLLLVSGCGTAPSRPAADNFLQRHHLLANSVFYLPASAIAQKLNGTERWDEQAQVWNLSVGRHELRTAPELSVVLIDGLPLLLAAAPIMQNGQLLLPESLWVGELAGWSPSAVPEIPLHQFSRLKTIVVDAGHGGKDPGAIGRNGLKEKLVVLDIARRLRDLLVRDGFRVVMTRYDDRFIPLGRRTAIANQEGADLFVSIHANAARNRKVRGFEVYYLSEATDDHARAIEASENAALPSEVEEGLEAKIPEKTLPIVWDLLYTEHRAESTELASAVVRGMDARRLSSRNRGVKTARFFVLKGTRMPAVLVEVGFVSHPSEEGRLRSASYRQELAEGIRSGILSFRKNQESRYVQTQ